jgi:hypothetical protein
VAASNLGLPPWANVVAATALRFVGGTRHTEVSMPVVLSIAFILAAALAVGVIANHFVRPFAKTEVQGIKLEVLLKPLLTLTVLLLSFVLVQAFGSYNRVRSAEGEEARRLAFEYEVGGYFDDDDIALPIQTALICYGRAVVNVEWPSLASGIQLHPLPTGWANEVDVVLAQIAAGDDTGQPFGTLLSADRDRADARGKRIVEAEPAVPFSVRLLMVLVSALALAAIATFTLPYVARGVQIGALVVMAVVFLAMHWTIYEIDHKFDGLIQVEPAEMTLLSTAMADQFAERHPDVVLPCNDWGERL